MNPPLHERGYPRVRHILLTAYQRFDDTGNLEEGSLGRTLNISEGGIMLETASPLPLLSKVEISLALKEEIIEVQGMVVHLRVNDRDRIETGIKFIEISDEARMKIRQFK